MLFGSCMQVSVEACEWSSSQTPQTQPKPPEITQAAAHCMYKKPRSTDSQGRLGSISDVWNWSESTTLKDHLSELPPA